MARARSTVTASSARARQSRCSALCPMIYRAFIRSAVPHPNLNLRCPITRRRHTVSLQARVGCYRRAPMVRTQRVVSTPHRRSIPRVPRRVALCRIRRPASGLLSESDESSGVHRAAHGRRGADVAAYSVHPILRAQLPGRLPPDPYPSLSRAVTRDKRSDWPLAA